jgi:hypothetical protein
MGGQPRLVASQRVLDKLGRAEIVMDSAGRFRPRRAGPDKALPPKVTGAETEKSIDFKSLIDLKFSGRV